jgi:hypothetical protein
VVEMFRGPESVGQPASYDVQPTVTARADLLAATAEDWADAMEVTWGPEPYRTHFRALWRPDGLCVRFDVEDRHPWHTMTHRDACLWEEEVVEIFLDPTSAGYDYAELEINPANVVCDLHIEQLEPERRVHMDWNFAGLETAVHRVEGCDDWVAIAWMPFADFASLSAATGARLPVVAGDCWQFNVFRIKRPHGPAQPDHEPIYAAWSVPEAPTFHTPGSFRPLRFL